MRKMTLIPLAIGLAVALQPAAHAQFGSGIVLDPTQSAHAIVQIGNEEKSIANEAEQIAQGQQIFTNTVSASASDRLHYSSFIRRSMLAPPPGAHSTRPISFSCFMPQA
jgi:hypothetical protein